MEGVGRVEPGPGGGMEEMALKHSSTGYVSVLNRCEVWPTCLHLHPPGAGGMESEDATGTSTPVPLTIGRK